MQRGSGAPPSTVGGQELFSKMLVGTSGPAHWLIAAMTAPPGAEISGFGSPVAVGPALENQQTSPDVIVSA
jgi:hypothetical protein